MAASRAAPRPATEPRPRPDGRHGAHVLHHPFPAAHARHVGAAGGLDGLDRAAAARALDHADQRHAILVGVALDEDVLLLDRGVGRAAAHREVVAGDGDGPAVDLGAAHHGVGRHQVDEVVAAVVLGLAGDAADLAERVLVDQPVDALAHGEAAAIVLALHLVGAAHAPGHLLTAAQLVHLRLPGHLAAFPVRLFQTSPARPCLVPTPGRTGYTESTRAGSWADGRNGRQQRAAGGALPARRPVPVVGHRQDQRLRRHRAS